MDIGFEIVGARSKRAGEDDSPSTVPMRAGIPPADQRKPSTDQRKVRRLQMVKNASGEPVADSLLEAQDIAPPIGLEDDMWTQGEGLLHGFVHPLTATKESPMDDPTGQATIATLNQRESALLSALSTEMHTSGERQKLAIELERVRASRRVHLAAHQDILLEDAFIRPVLTPVIAHQRTTAATDWILDEPDQVADGNVTQAMRAEASAWFGRVHPAVKADAGEYAEQARGMARRVAGQFGLQGAAAEAAFLETAAFLNRTAYEHDVPEMNPQEISGPVQPMGDGVHPPMNGAGGGDQGIDPGSNQADQPSMVEDPKGINASRRTAAEVNHEPPDNSGKGSGDWECYGCGAHVESLDKGFNTKCPYCGSYELHLSDSAKSKMGSRHGSLLSRAASIHLAGEVPDAFKEQWAKGSGDGDEDDEKGNDHDADDKDKSKDKLPDFLKDKEARVASDGTSYPAHEQAGFGETSLPTRNPAQDREPLDNFVPETAQTGVHPEMPGAPAQSADPEQANDGTTVTSRRARKTALTYGELPDTIGTGRAPQSMACANEGCDEFMNLYSATKGDYFMMDPSETVTCGACGEPMKLARANSGVTFEGSRKLAEGGGQTCATCGAPIERDPEGEENRSWHHNDGSTHDHEAKPKSGGTEARRRTALTIGEMEGRAYEATCPNEDCSEHGTAFVHDDLSGGSDQDDNVAECPECDTPLVWENRTASRRTAGIYCKDHNVWVGDGNASTHEGCSKEQKATEKTKEGSQRVAVNFGTTIDGLFAKLSSEENGQGESSLENVTVTNATDVMWPVELTEEEKKARDAANVASVPTPGGEAGYPQPTASLTPQQAAFRNRVQSNIAARRS